MAQYIDKSALVTEIEKLIDSHKSLKTLDPTYCEGLDDSLDDVLSILDTIEVIDPYEQCVQYDSIKSGIQAHAETYSFNIESMLFNQLTKEQQELWRNEIEQAVISGGEAGVELAKDPRYNDVNEYLERNTAKK